MRRLLMLCLLVMLPFQGAWSAVAGIAALDAPCAKSQQATQQASPHGAHGGDVAASADGSAALSDCDQALAAEACDGTCSHCHGHVPVAMISLPSALGGTGAGVVVRARGARGAPDHIPARPLRPPLARPA